MGAKKVLYLQHASALGGSCMSLLYTIQALDRRRFTPTVALTRPTPDVLRLYGDAGIRVISWPGIRTFEHTELVFAHPARPLSCAQLAASLHGWGESERRTLALVRHTRPDIVHLNSAVLAPSARALFGAHVPFVWHAREPPVRGTVGLRYGFLRHAMLHWPDEMIFLSAAERQAWVQGRRGVVVHNFVDLRRFDGARDQALARRELGIPTTSPVVLFLGGLSEVKGIQPLLRALALIRRELPDVVCLLPGTVDAAPRGALLRLARAVLPRLGTGTFVQRVQALQERLGLQGVCRRLPFTTRVEELLCACDVLAFPAIRQHFARPIIEAAAMARPVVASDFPVLAELVDEGETGFLVPPNDAPALATALLAVLRDPDRARAMGEVARVRAHARYNAAANIHAIMRVYDDILQRRVGGANVTARVA